MMTNLTVDTICFRLDQSDLPKRKKPTSDAAVNISWVLSPEFKGRTILVFFFLLVLPSLE